MQNITQTAIDPPVEIWPYIEALTQPNVVDRLVFDRQLVKAVYRNNQNTYDHVLLPTDRENVFVVIVVDLGAQARAPRFGFECGIRA